jgi:transposase
MWTEVHRRTADRKGLRYPSNLSEAEWWLVEPPIPPAKRGGCKRSVNIRKVLNGIFMCCRPAASGRRCRRPAAKAHGVRLSRPLVMGRHIGAHPS